MSLGATWKLDERVPGKGLHRVSQQPMLADVIPWWRLLVWGGGPPPPQAKPTKPKLSP